MAQPSPPGDDRGPRIAAIDAARGIAILAMIVYHFAWDLADFHLVGWNVPTGLAWQIFARSVATTFLVLVGAGLVLSVRGGFRPLPFLRRLAIIVAAAALVSFGTWWFAGDALAFFGILHMIAVGSVFALPFLFLPSWLVALAAVAVLVAPYYLANPFFDAPGWWWLGLVTVTPRSVDYVPMLPWFAPILAGILVGRGILRFAGDSSFAKWRPDGPLGRFAVAAGRWSLAIYLVHQLILVGILSVVAPLIPVDPAVETTIFMRDCTLSCTAARHEAPFCTAYCSCVHSGIGGTDLMTATRTGMNTDQTARWNAIIGQCRQTEMETPFNSEPAPAN